MKRALLCSVSVIFLLFYQKASAQLGYAGYRSGNYTGVNSVFTNPANIADSRFKWDVNLFGIHSGIGSRNSSLATKDINEILNSNADSLLLKNAGTIKALGNLDVYGPSFMVSVGKKTSFAITTRARVLVNISNLDGQLVKTIKDEVDNGITPYTINSTSPQTITANGWTDLGFSLAHVFSSNPNQFFKAGITLKYLLGYANSYINVNNLQGTVKYDPSGAGYLQNATGNLTIGAGGVDIDNFNSSNASQFNGHGFGGDIGAVYEYRPDAEQYTGRYQNKYKVKIGLALLDVGRIKYNADTAYTKSYSVNVPAQRQLALSDFDGKTFSELKTYADGNRFFTANNTSNSYSISLPTNIQADIDLHLHRGLYVDLAGQFSIHSQSKYYNPWYAHHVTLTPRFEGSFFGAYLPINYNSVSGFNAGVALRAGPLYLGSGSIITALAGKSHQLDIHFGLHVGVQYKKPHAKKEIPAIAPPKVADRDSDGIPDTTDACPDVPGLAKYNGCPIPDSDGDSINDEEDKCPTVAGVAAYNGCPVPDRDKDGVADDQDKCPDTPGLARYSGCPIPDTDGDGLNDEEDKCPLLKGEASNNGCPAIKAEIIKRVNYAAKNLLFKLNSAIILKKSYKQLDEVVRILKSDSLLKMSIDGHTDKTGTEAANMSMSQKRADAARKYFVSNGISASRITAHGFGFSKPIADNKTKAGRAKNRRVEFTLTY